MSKVVSISSSKYGPIGIGPQIFGKIQLKFKLACNEKILIFLGKVGHVIF